MAEGRSLRRLGYGGASYRDFHSARNVASAVAFVVGGLVYARAPSAFWILIIAVLVGLALSLIVRRYCLDVMGRVAGLNSACGEILGMTRIRTIAGAFILLIVAAVAGVPLQMMLGLWGVGWSLGYSSYLYSGGGMRMRPHRAVAFAALTAVSVTLIMPGSVLAVLDGPDGIHVLVAIYLVSLSITMLMCSLLDHRLLVRTRS